MVLLVFEAQTFIFAVLYQKNQSFLPKVLYCTKKTKKTNVSRPLAKDQPGPDQLPWAKDQETYAFLVQYITFGQKDCFCLYSTAKMKVWVSKTNKTIRFYCVFRDGRAILLVQYSKNEALRGKDNKNIVFLFVFVTAGSFFVVLYQ